MPVPSRWIRLMVLTGWFGAPVCFRCEKNALLAAEHYSARRAFTAWKTLLTFGYQRRLVLTTTFSSTSTVNSPSPPCSVSTRTLHSFSSLAAKLAAMDRLIGQTKQ